MTSTWIVGVDGSDHSRIALAWAANHARGRADELHAIGAWQVPTAGVLPLGVPQGAWKEAEAATRECVEDAVRGLAAPRELRVEPIVCNGGAASVLLDAAASAALLVVGSRGRGGFARLVLGSVSHQCATHAEVPTVVVPHHTDPAARVRKIVVGVDGSDNARAALGWAIDFGNDADIEVLGTWEPSPMSMDDLDTTYFDDLARLSKERFDTFVDEVQASRGDGLALERVFLYSPAGPALAEASHDADLVVVGARGHGAIGAALLGSVSTYLLHHAGSPVAVVPAAAELD